MANRFVLILLNRMLCAQAQLVCKGSSSLLVETFSSTWTQSSRLPEHTGLSVGTKDVTTWVITTPEGYILIDSGYVGKRRGRSFTE
jgi:hypothetical protein